MDKGALLLENFPSMNNQRVKIEESVVPSFVDNAAEVTDFLAEPKSSHASLNVTLDSIKENLVKSSGLDDFSYEFEFGFRTNFGGMDSFISQGDDDLKLGVLDGLLDDVAEVDDFYAANDLSTVCNDFLLDVKFAENFTKLENPVEGSFLGSSYSESHSPEFSGGSVAVRTSDSSTTAPELECKDSSHDKVVSCGLHGTSKRKYECQVSAVEGSPSSFDSNRFDELENDDNILLSSIFLKCKKRVKSSVVGTKVKSLGKPPRRYIEECSDRRSGYLMRGKKVTPNTSTDRHPKVMSFNGSSNESSQVPSGCRLRGRRLKKCSPSLGFESDEDTFSFDADYGQVRKKKFKLDDRRKNQRMWTLAEVMKLIDGISEFGVGKWTDVKRHLFSSSCHRTPIDLRDKWRNLLRASYAHQKNKGVANPKHAMRTLPKSVLCRIRELDTIHPYPGVSSKKCNGSTDSSGHPTKAESSSFTSHGRILRNRNHN